MALLVFEIQTLWDDKYLHESDLESLERNKPLFERSQRNFEAAIRVQSNDESIHVGVVSDSEYFQGNSSIAGESRHQYLDSDSMCSSEYVYQVFSGVNEFGEKICGDTEGKNGFVSFINPTSNKIRDVKVEFLLRDFANHRDSSAGTSYFRGAGLLFEDNINVVNRVGTYQEAKAHCESMGSGWQIPSSREYSTTTYRNRRGEGFSWNDQDAFFWTRDGVLHGTEVSPTHYATVGWNGWDTLDVDQHKAGGVSMTKQRNYRCVLRVQNNQCYSN